MSAPSTGRNISPSAWERPRKPAPSRPPRQRRSCRSPNSRPGSRRDPAHARGRNLDRPARLVGRDIHLGTECMDATIARARAESAFNVTPLVHPDIGWKDIEAKKAELVRQKTERLRALRFFQSAKKKSRSA